MTTTRAPTTQQDLDRQIGALAEVGVRRDRIYVDKKSGATTALACGIKQKNTPAVNRMPVVFADESMGHSSGESCTRRVGARPTAPSAIPPPTTPRLRVDRPDVVARPAYSHCLDLVG
jgi:hypothetical protein